MVKEKMRLPVEIFARNPPERSISLGPTGHYRSSVRKSADFSCAELLLENIADKSWNPARLEVVTATGPKEIGQGLRVLCSIAIYPS